MKLVWFRNWCVKTEKRFQGSEVKRERERDIHIHICVHARIRDTTTTKSNTKP